MGGATGLIGDPKMTGERTLNSPETVEGWVGRIREQLDRFYDFEGPNAAVAVNNLDWTQDLGDEEVNRLRSADLQLLKLYPVLNQSHLVRLTQAGLH